MGSIFYDKYENNKLKRRQLFHAHFTWWVCGIFYINVLSFNKFYLSLGGYLYLVFTKLLLTN